MKLLKFKDLKERQIVNSRMTLARWMQSQGFPQPIHLGPNSRAWDEAEIEAWLKGRRACSSSEAA
jgi:predicted DNA-binding transcriptional regulator AlpA